MNAVLAEKPYVAPVDVFIAMGRLSRKGYEDCRFGRIPFLERAIIVNLHKAVRILDIVRFHAAEAGMKPSETVYKRWGKGPTTLLRFSISGNPYMEMRYSTHFVPQPVHPASAERVTVAEE